VSGEASPLPYSLSNVLEGNKGGQVSSPVVFNA
jgi:hypothetical protein